MPSEGWQRCCNVHCTLASTATVPHRPPIYFTEHHQLKQDSKSLTEGFLRRAVFLPTSSSPELSWLSPYQPPPLPPSPHSPPAPAAAAAPAPPPVLPAPPSVLPLLPPWRPAAPPWLLLLPLLLLTSPAAAALCAAAELGHLPTVRPPATWQQRKTAHTQHRVNTATGVTAGHHWVVCAAGSLSKECLAELQSNYQYQYQYCRD